jgi:penicillin-binding protein 1B
MAKRSKRRGLPSLKSRGLIVAIAVVTLAIISLAAWLVRLDLNIKNRFAEKRFAPPVEFYSAPETVEAGLSYPDRYFEHLFTRLNYRRREFGQSLQPGDFSIWKADDCQNIVGPASPPPPEKSSSFWSPSPPVESQPQAIESLAYCIAFHNRNTESEGANDESDAVQIASFSASGRAMEVYSGSHPKRVAHIELEPEIFAQYYGEQPVLRNIVNLGETPPLCLNALLAIEDAQFLEHTGVSITGLMRAFLTNLRFGRVAQGGSTITQQLVKNYFLSDERTLKRKITEIAMAFLVEQRASKDEILETYINLIYMGQNGPFQVRGFSAASEHYFGRPLADLNLPDCALMAAIVNSPGLFNPFTHPDKALKRRSRVLDRMLELGMITNDDSQAAKASPLPSRPERILTEPAPYFVQAVRREIDSLGLNENDGLRVYTTLDLRAQESAQRAIRSGLEKLEKKFSNLQRLKEHGKDLEAVIISADPRTGAVQAMVGGRGFKATQFNRATDSRRQVGSVMKPFVYLTALENSHDSSTKYTPLTIVTDKPITHRYEGQSWTPHNYDGTYRGEIPLFYALKESLNAPTANLGIQIGLSNIVNLAHRMGISSELRPLPSLSLGAFEISPMEVLQAYTTITEFGTKHPLTLLRRVEDLNHNDLFVFSGDSSQAASPVATAELIGIMKQVLISGTGQGVRASGFANPAAGKTGTTNDKKDAWFAGFTPYHTAVVWVGYDDNTSHNLTGGSGAVPIWTDYMKGFASRYPADDFKWPNGVKKVNLTSEQLLGLGVPNKGTELPKPVELILSDL